MKRTISILIGILLVWASAWGLAQRLDVKQREMRSQHLKLIMSKIEENPNLGESEPLLLKLEDVVIQISREPSLLNSYEIMLSLPEAPRSFWLHELAR